MRIINIVLGRALRDTDTFPSRNRTPELNFGYSELKIILLINFKINLRLY